MKSYEEIFSDNTEEKLMNAVKNGLDVYLRNYQNKSEYDSEYETFFGAAVSYGTPALVKTCVDMGADVNCVDPWEASHSSPRAAASSLVEALYRHDAAALRALFGCGARMGVLNGLSWNLARNDVPEAAYDERAAELKRRLDEGSEILKALREAGFRVPGMNADDGEMSFCGVRFGGISGGGLHDDGECPGYDEESKRYAIWKDWEKGEDEWDHDYSDGGDDGEDRSSRYCENMRAYTNEELFPCHGTRPGALWHAVSPEALRKMIAAGADVNAADSVGWTTLHHLAYHCDGEYYFEPNAMMRILLDAGADINAVCNKMTPMTLAAMHVRDYPKALETLKLLLINGADFEAEGRGVIWWIRDYWYSNKIFEKRILQEILYEIYYSAQPENANASHEEFAGEKFSHEPLSKENIDLMTAAFWGTPEDIAPILARGADINARSSLGYTPLLFASVWNYAQTVQFLIDKGADLHAKNFWRNTALKSAIMTQDRSVIKTLLDAGSDLEAADDWGYTPLMVLVHSCRDENFAQSFINKGADVNAKNNDGETALMIVARSTFDTDVARVLLDAGADVNARDDQGRTALDIALKEGYEWNDAGEFVKFMLQSGADPKFMAIKTPKDGYGSLAEKVLTKAGLSSHTRFCDVFAENSAEEIATAVKNGLVLDIEDVAGDTFFRAALKYGSSEILRVCVEQGVDVNGGWSGSGSVMWRSYPKSWPLYEAIKAINADAVRVLLEAGAAAEMANVLDWHERTNVFPEGTEGNGEAKEFKARLDAGEEILRALREAGHDVPGEDITYTGIETKFLYDKYNGLDVESGRTWDDPDIAAVWAFGCAVSPGALKLLICEGTDVNARGCGGGAALHVIALGFAEYFEPCAMLELLLDAGADANARDEEGITPLMIMAYDMKEQPRVMKAVKVLAEAGADFRARDSEKRSVYEWMERFVDSAGTVETLMRRELMDAIKRAFGAKSRASVKKRADADMLLAAFCGTSAEIESALARGADANAASKNGYTALMFASVFNATEIAQCLIDNGAEVNAGNRLNETALTLAALSERSDTQTIRALIAAGASVESVGNEGKTPLMKAMECSHYKTARVLMASGADVGRILEKVSEPEENNENGKSDKENKRDAKNRETEELLRKFGLDV